MRAAAEMDAGPLARSASCPDTQAGSDGPAPGQPAPAWWEFDPAWYARAYPEVVDLLIEPSPTALRAFYLLEGQGRGHSPNMVFDESFYLARHSAVRERVARGEFRSGFAHYCAEGWTELAPHWLFDVAYYAGQLAEPTLAAVNARGFVNHYDEYLRVGAAAGRSGHLLFDPAQFRAAHPDQDPAQPAFLAYLQRLHAGSPEPRCSVHFDPAWYRRTYPEAARAIAEGSAHGALHHYLREGAAAGLDPLPDFSERFYRAANDDVGAALAAGTLVSGYEHFLHHGVFEFRAPAPSVDLAAYWQRAPAARRTIAAGRARDLFTYLLMTASSVADAAPVEPEEPATRAQFRRRARAMLAHLPAGGLDFTLPGAPALSAIVVAHDQFALTMQTLASLRGNFAGAIELILVDSGSADETRRIEAYVRGAKHVGFADNVGFVDGVNAALPLATAPAVLLLNNDVELAPFAVAAALARLGSDPTIGAVGGKVVRTHGRLQEAGCIVWRDGTTAGYLRDAPASAPEADFVRDVDFCSAAFLLLRAEALAATGGFDPAYAPAYYEDADLCLRLRAAGWRVVYDPAVSLTHYEYASARGEAEAHASMARGREIFRARHRAVLTRKHAPDPARAVFARRATPARHRVLFLEDVVPLHRLGSGYGRANDVVRALAALGAEVTIFPLNPTRVPLPRIAAGLPDGVETLHDRTLEDLPDLLASRPGFYDVVWISRAHNLAKALPALAEACADADRVRVVLDTEAVFALRDAAKAALAGSTFDLANALAAEFAPAWFCRHVLAVNAAEADCLRWLGLPSVAVLGTMATPRPTPAGFEDRAGMLFLGAIHALDSPNYDALAWFIEAVMPHLGAGARLTVAGHLAPGVSLDRFAGDPRVTLLGEVEYLAPLYDRHRLVIAPTRYAAGTPYKVYEAAAHGVPLVASDLLRGQLGWRDGVEILSAPTGDAAAFADRITRLTQNLRLWGRLRRGALARLAAENSAESFRARVAAVLDDAEAT